MAERLGAPDSLVFPISVIVGLSSGRVLGLVVPEKRFTFSFSTHFPFIYYGRVGIKPSVSSSHLVYRFPQA